MTLSAEAMKYRDELFRRSRAVLERERERNREQLWQGMTRIEDAEKRAGYPGVLQPAVDFAVALGKARADAIWKGYEFDREEINEEVIMGIVVDAGSILEQCLGGLIAGEKGRMASVAHRTATIDPGANAKIGELTRHVTRTICDAKEDRRNELMLRMFEAKRCNDGGRATMKVSELARKIQKFRDDLAAHFELWGQFLTQRSRNTPRETSLRLQGRSAAWRGNSVACDLT